MSEPIDYRAEVLKVWPLAIDNRSFLSPYSYLVYDGDMKYGINPPVLGSSTHSVAEAWADAYSKLPKPSVPQPLAPPVDARYKKDYLEGQQFCNELFDGNIAEPMAAPPVDAAQPEPLGTCSRIGKSWAPEHKAPHAKLTATPFPCIDWKPLEPEPKKAELPPDPNHGGKHSDGMHTNATYSKKSKREYEDGLYDIPRYRMSTDTNCSIPDLVGNWCEFPDVKYAFLASIEAHNKTIAAQPELPKLRRFTYAFPAPDMYRCVDVDPILEAALRENEGLKKKIINREQWLGEHSQALDDANDELSKLRAELTKIIAERDALLEQVRIASWPERLACWKALGFPDGHEGDLVAAIQIVKAELAASKKEK